MPPFSKTGFPALANVPWATLGRMELPGEFWSKISEQTSRSPLFEPAPLFTLIVVTEGDGADAFAASTWQSLLAQSYPHWKAIVVGPADRRTDWAMPSDARFEWVNAPLFCLPHEAKNLALAKAEGWVGVMGLGDVLSPAALFQLAWEIEKHPEAPGFFTHEANLTKSGSQVREFVSKGFWNPWVLAQGTSVGRFWMTRTEHLAPFEALASGWDERLALLRLACTFEFQLVPYYLYYRREIDIPSPAASLWCASVAQVLKAEGHDCRVEVADGKIPELKITPSVASEGNLVSVVMCFRDRAEMTCEAVRSLVALKSQTPLEILLVNNDSSADSLTQVETFLKESSVPARLVSFPGAFNFGRMHNWAVREHCRGNLLLLLNNDVRLVRADLDAWVAWALQPKVATVGALLRFAHGGVQHSGIRGWFGGGARMVRVGNSHEPVSGGLQQVFANTFAACLVKREAFDSIGGLREKDLVNGFGDVAFCFEALRQGWKHLFLPSVEGVHAESSSRGQPYEYWEEFGLEREYPEILQRLLREDAGVNRVPGSDGSFRAAVMSAALVKFRNNYKWLDPVKPTLKKWLRNLPLAGENG